MKTRVMDVSSAAAKERDQLSMDLVMVSRDEVHGLRMFAPTKLNSRKNRVRIRSWSASSLGTAPTTSEEDEEEVTVREAELETETTTPVAESFFADRNQAEWPVPATSLPQEQQPESEEESRSIPSASTEQKEDNERTEAEDEKLFQRLVFKALETKNLPPSPPIIKEKSVRFLHENGAVLYPFKPFPPKLTAVEAAQRERDCRVRFGTITVREFPNALGDHPDVTGGGPPICLDYSCDADDARTYTVTVQEREWNHGGRRRRTLAQLRIPAHTRRYWLLKEQHGPARRECGERMRQAELEAKRVQRQRAWSRALQGLEGCTALQQKLARQVKKLSKNNNKEENAAAQQWNRKLKQEKKRKQQQVHKIKTTSPAA